VISVQGAIMRDNTKRGSWESLEGEEVTNPRLRIETEMRVEQ
jgi:hypothetical protein